MSDDVDSDGCLRLEKRLHPLWTHCLRPTFQPLFVHHSSSTFVIQCINIPPSPPPPSPSDLLLSLSPPPSSFSFSSSSSFNSYSSSCLLCVAYLKKGTDSILLSHSP